jgi:beta-barrel assembly-enhancing protease
MMRSVKKVFLLLSLLSLLMSCKTMEEIKADQSKQKQLETVYKEVEIGKAVFAKLAGKYGILRDNETTEYLNKFGKTLALYTERQELDYFFGILATDKVNAYALPGGYILISIGALKRIDNPSALAGVISHELGHVNLKHILQQVKIQVSYNFWEILARFLAGPRQLVTNVVGQISDKIEEQLFMKGLSTDNEFEADRYAVTLLQALNISPEPYINYMKNLEKEEGNKDLEVLDKTHPKINDRMVKLSPSLTQGLPTLKITDQFKKFKDKISGFKVQ